MLIPYINTRSGVGFSIVAAMAVLAVCLFHPPCVAASEIAWSDDYEAAVQRAAGSNSILMLHFYTDNCPPCKLLDRKTFRDPALVSLINQNVVPTKIDANRRRDLATKYNVSRWPTDIYLYPNGEEIYRGVSDQDPAVYAQKINRIALRHRDWSLEREAIAQSTQRRQDQAIAANAPQIQAERPVYSGNEGRPVKSQATNWKTSTTESTASTQMPPSPSRQRVIKNPFLAQNPIVVPPMNPNDSTAAANGPPLPRADEVSTRPVPRSVPPAAPAAPAAAPIISGNKLIAQPASSHSESRLGNAIAHPSHYESQPSQSVMAKNIGLDGYCPVSLIESIDISSDPAWIQGSASFAVRHRGRVYHCVNEKARQKLLASPDQFTPVLSGFDLVHFFKTGELLDGSCGYGCIQKQTHRVFLFANQSNYQEFEREMEHYSRLLDRAHPQRVAVRPDETQIR
jgi:thiol-disulfide isomerase/thioredoxin